MDQDKRIDTSSTDSEINLGVGAHTGKPTQSSSPKPTLPSVPTPDRPAEMTVVFHGAGREYFQIWIVNLCLTLVTFGLFSAWAKVRKKRYIYSHTVLGGTPFQYLGQPIPILKGRIIAACGFGCYYVSSNFVLSLLPYVLVVGFIAAPWVLSRSAAFNARYSAFRNMTFFFEGDYWKAFKVLYAWGVLPLFGVAMVASLKGNPVYIGVASAVLGLHFPWLLRRIKNFIVAHTSYGGKRGSFEASGGQFFKIYLIAMLIVMAVAFPAAFLTVLLVAPAGKTWLITLTTLVPIYAGYVMAYAYIQARSGNLVWNNIRLGPIYFLSTLKSIGLAKLYITNAIGIVLSLGMLIPWAVIRTHKYRIDHLQVMRTGSLYQFQGSKTHSVAAFGAETIDIFDMDLSL